MKKKRYYVETEFDYIPSHLNLVISVGLLVFLLFKLGDPGFFSIVGYVVISVVIGTIFDYCIKWLFTKKRYIEVKV